MNAGNKLIISGVYYSGGGLSNVMAQLARHLGSYFEVVCLGFVPSGMLLPQDPVPGCRFIPVPANRNGFIVKDRELLRNLVEVEQFSNILLLGPVHLNRSFIKQLQPFNICLTAYTAYEGKMKKDYDLADIAQLDRCIFYTQYNHQCYTEMLAGNGSAPEILNKSGFVAHGTACDVFYPVHGERAAKKKLARKQVYPGKQFTEDAFIILNINRPYLRKRLDISLAAFKLFSAGKKNVFLHFHLGTTNQSEADELQRQIDEAGLQQQVFLTYSADQKTSYKEEWVNLLYNACDVGMTTSMGEGWGMGLFEHAATYAPVIAPEHTSFIENWEGTGMLVPTSDTQFVFYENADMFIVRADDMAQALHLLYSDEELYDRVAERCYRHATSAKFKWENTAAYFAKTISAAAHSTENKNLINE